MNYSNKKYDLVIGMGATGYSVARYLSQKGSDFVVFDTRDYSNLGEPIRKLNKNIPLYFGEISEQILLNAREIIISPGVSRDEVFIKKALHAGIPVIGDIELFMRVCDKPVVAITGSNGKSTVTTMIGLVLDNAGFKVSVGGNLGTPALDLIENESDIFVLELSSFQLESIETSRFEVAVILNISEDHLDRYSSYRDYCLAKHRIYKFAKRKVFYMDDKNTWPESVDKELDRGFSLHKKSQVNLIQTYCIDDDGWLVTDNEKIIDTALIKLRGSHNFGNALAVCAAVQSFGELHKSICDTLKEFSGLPHRCEWVAEKQGITFINDSKATNVGATLSALAGFSSQYERIVLIAGGDGKGAKFDDLIRYLNQNVFAVVLIGKDAEKISSGLGGNVLHEFASDMRDAVFKAVDIVKSGLVLLSPACASFDMFDGYEDRGGQFKQVVLEELIE